MNSLLRAGIVVGGLLLTGNIALAEDIVCTDPKIAGDMIEELNGLRKHAAIEAEISVIDLEDITTRHKDGSLFACHFTADFSNGVKMPGIYSLKLNAAGDLISMWEPDALSRHRH